MCTTNQTEFVALTLTARDAACFCRYYWIFAAACWYIGKFSLYLNSTKYMYHSAPQTRW